MNVSSRQQLDAAYRTSLFLFVWRFFSVCVPGEEFINTWHVELVCDLLEQALQGRHKRILITLPPRHLKSFMASTAFVAYALGRNPSLKIMVASYAAELAAKMGRDTQSIMRSPEYARLFPRTILSPTRNTPVDIQTTAGGNRRGLGLGGSTTGFGADILIIDDLMKAVDIHSPELRQRARDYFDEALFSRLNDKRDGIIIAIQQRLHEEDFAAYCLEKGFYHLNLAAIAESNEQHTLADGRIVRRRRGEPLSPRREPLDVLEQIRLDMGNAAFHAQYQQNPVQPDDNALRWDRFLIYDEPLEREQYIYVVQSWDTAFTSSPNSNYSAGITFGLTQDRLWHVLHVERVRLDYPALKARVSAYARRWRPDKIVIEQASSGLALLADFQQERGYVWDRVHGMKNIFGKEIRFQQQLDKIEGGRIALPVDSPWLAAFKQEMLAFPHGRHDDQVDAFTQFLEWTSTRGRGFVRRALQTTQGA